MAFVVVGVLLLLLRWAEWGPTSTWPWWALLLPFALAVVWWTWSDSTGLTKRREMDKMDERRKARRDKAIEALGKTLPKGRRGRR